MFYIKAKLSIKVRGISGHSQEGVSRLVNANTEKEALSKFESHCKRKYANMEPDYITYEYLEIASEIK